MKNSSKFNKWKEHYKKRKFQLTQSHVQKLNMSIEFKKFKNKNMVHNMKSFDDTYITLQSHTGKYRVLQGNPCNENRIPAIRRGFPVMKTGFSLWELTYRAGIGFAVWWTCQKLLEQEFIGNLPEMHREPTAASFWKKTKSWYFQL